MFTVKHSKETNVFHVLRQNLKLSEQEMSLKNKMQILKGPRKKGTLHISVDGIQNTEKLVIFRRLYRYLCSAKINKRDLHFM